MSKIEYDSVDLKYFKETEEGRKYLEYNDKVGGVIVVYEECIKRGIPWEELLDFHPPEDAVI